jgi:hypothetical protein
MVMYTGKQRIRRNCDKCKQPFVPTGKYQRICFACRDNIWNNWVKNHKKTTKHKIYKAENDKN